MDKSPVRVFLLDDHEVVRRGLHDLLESEGDIEIFGESGSVREAIARIPGPAAGRRGSRRTAA
jgi:two-component system response regulator DevR